MRWRRLGLVSVLALAACGSTVQQTAPLRAPAGGGDELGAPQDAPGATGAGVTPDGATPDVPASTAEERSPSQSTGSGTAPSAAPVPGGTTARGAVDRSPVRVGLLYVNNDAASSAGIDNGNTFTPKQVLDAMVKSVNARGGLAGRRVVPSFAEVKSSSSSYSADLAAACARFTQDDHVELAMSFLGGLVDDQFAACLAKAGVVYVADSLGDDTSVAEATTTASVLSPSADRRSRVLLEQLTASGHLTRQNKLGVLVEGCPYNQRAEQRTIAPTASRLGLKIVATHTTRCFASINDLGNLASEANNAVLKFRQAGVDRVLFVSGVEGNMMFLFATAADSQGFRPGYALTSLVYPNVVKNNTPASQLANAKGLGWLPATDDGSGAVASTEARACVTALKGQGLSPAAPADYLFAYSICDGFSLTDRVLSTSRGQTAPGPWLAALHSVGSSFHAAAIVDGRTDFTGSRRDGPAGSRIFAWNDGCSCFRYTGATGGL